MKIDAFFLATFLTVALQAGAASTDSFKADVAKRILKSGYVFEKNDEQQFRRKLTASALMAEGGKMADSKDEFSGACDSAFLSCLARDKCVDCFLEMNSKDINWASVTKDTSCDGVLDILYKQGHCSVLKKEKVSEETFCTVFNTCVLYEADSDDIPSSDDVDCSALTECNWPGFHPSFIGDGVCHDEDVGGCYNTEICGFDGGDCCEDTCRRKGAFLECGHDGYSCRDPASKYCEPDLTPHCDEDIIIEDDDYVSPDSVDCTADKSLYRLVMYDSFGDGWDATKIIVTKKGNGKSNPSFSGGLEKGSQGTRYMCLSKTADCYDVEVAGGVWGNEVSWEVKPLSDGAPAIAGGGAPMKCQFSVAGGKCDDSCTGKPNLDPTDDPDYKEFKDMFKCITERCPIQVATCQKDPVCEECFKEDAPDYCFGIDSFNAVVDCTMCSCTENKDSWFCTTDKTAPGIVVPTDKDGNEELPDFCSPGETIKGGNAMMTFGQCTDFDEIGIMVTDFDQNNFGDLDQFESCAHAYQAKTDHGGHTALSCLQILVNAMNGAMDDEKSDSTLPKDAIASLANLLYHDGEGFCDCAKEASDECPLCPSFKNFKTLLYESLDACQSLDEIDCAAWEEFYPTCKNNLVVKFNGIDFGKKEQCDYVHDTCGGAGPFPAFRRLDCGKETPKAAWDFYTQFSDACLKDGPAPTPVSPPVPVPTPTAPTPDVSPSDKKPYVPPEDKDKGKTSPSKSKSKSKKKSHWFRNLVLLCMIGGGAYYFYKRQADGFSFVRYRRMRNFGFGGNGHFGGDDNDMYSGLAMESSTNFEPPSLPPMPSQIDSSNFGTNYTQYS